MQEEVNKAIKSDLLDEKHLQKLIQLAKEELNKNNTIKIKDEA